MLDSIARIGLLWMALTIPFIILPTGAKQSQIPLDGNAVEQAINNLRAIHGRPDAYGIIDSLIEFAKDVIRGVISAFIFEVVRRSFDRLLDWLRRLWRVLRRLRERFHSRQASYCLC